jgi:thiamine kinase-like enzyme
MTELEPSIDESNSNTDIHTMPNLEIEDIRDFFIKELSDVNLEPVVIDDEEFFNKILLLEQSIKVFEENLTRCLTNSKSITDEELRQILKILEHTIIVFENRLVKFSNDLNASDDNKKFIKERLEKLSILKQNIHEYDQILNNKNHFILLKLIPVLVVIILKYFVL